MRGKHRVIVSTKRLKYDFEIRKNLTIIRGDSATGKTTLVDIIQEYVNNPTGRYVTLSTCTSESTNGRHLLIGRILENNADEKGEPQYEEK